MYKNSTTNLTTHMSFLPLVTIIVPTYNVADYIENAIDSLLYQTYTNLEIIIVDDFSTDDTLKIIKNKYSKNNKIKIFENKKNLGSSFTRNIGIQQAKGKYIALLDADDYYVKDKIKKQVQLMEANPDIGVCSSFLQCFGLQNNIIEFSVNHSDIKDNQLLGCPVAQPATMFRTSILRKYDLYYNENFRLAQDYELFVRMLELNIQFISIPEPLVYYRISGNQASFVMDKGKMIRNKEQWEVSKKIHYKVLNKLINEKSELYNIKWVDALLAHQVLREFADLKPFINWAKRLIEYNEKKGSPFSSKFLEKTYKKSVAGYFLAQKELSWKILYQYLTVYPDIESTKMNFLYQLKYITKCLFFLKH
ncbi:MULTISPECIES: glycosyltransferase [Apibacter]|uniref:glycosyltransferase family 2 protein n=1 Tax=Apibacter TaxID=1778601 RepID=UPI001C69C31C|nr:MULTISPECIES: glycosyltransferase [Apibacter]QYN51687.1 glycosyltransferase [Apibacter sp. ESL0404]